jgi:endonuclease-8
MPEGDTIHRTARTLQRALAGKKVVRFETVLANLARANDDTPLKGRTIENVHAIGKHLVIDFEGGIHLRTHMRMNGSWHIYRSGEKWQRPRRDMRLVIATDDFEAVGFNIPVAEFAGDLRELEHLGPDLLAAEFDVNDAVQRLRSRPDEAIADVLLDQRVLAGVGNIWKSETLFRAHVHPFTLVRDLTDEQLAKIATLARKLLQMSVKADRPYDYFVYMRGGQRCRNCGTAIQRKQQGLDARSTYWCSKCQP